VSGLRIEAGAATAIAGLHGQAADAVDGAADSAPGSVDAGPADVAIAAILQRVATEASDLSQVHRGAQTVMQGVASDYAATEESVDADFDALSRDVPKGWTR
jgi:hypothetical protein